jgi:hypothetical protein
MPDALSEFHAKYEALRADKRYDNMGDVPKALIAAILTAAEHLQLSKPQPQPKPLPHNVDISGTVTGTKLYQPAGQPQEQPQLQSKGNLIPAP